MTFLDPLSVGTFCVLFVSSVKPFIFAILILFSFFGASQFYDEMVEHLQPQSLIYQNSLYLIFLIIPTLIFGAIKSRLRLSIKMVVYLSCGYGSSVYPLTYSTKTFNISFITLVFLINSSSIWVIFLFT